MESGDTDVGIGALHRLRICFLASSVVLSYAFPSAPAIPLESSLRGTQPWLIPIVFTCSPL